MRTPGAIGRRSKLDALLGRSLTPGGANSRQSNPQSAGSIEAYRPLANSLSIVHTASMVRARSKSANSQSRNAGCSRASRGAARPAVEARPVVHRVHKRAASLVRASACTRTTSAQSPPVPFSYLQFILRIIASHAIIREIACNGPDSEVPLSEPSPRALLGRSGVPPQCRPEMTSRTCQLKVARRDVSNIHNSG